MQAMLFGAIQQSGKESTLKNALLRRYSRYENEATIQWCAKNISESELREQQKVGITSVITENNSLMHLMIYFSLSSVELMNLMQDGF